LKRLRNAPRVHNAQMIMTDNLGYRWSNHPNLNDTERFTSPWITGRGAHPAVRYTPKPQQSDQEYIRCNLDRANGPRFNVTRIRTTLSFGPSTRVTAQATNPSDYRAWRKRGRLTGPRRQGSRKRRARKGARKSEGKRE